MLSDEVLDKVIERLANRIEQGNEYILEQIGKKIKQIGTLKPTQARQLEQVIKYGGDYDKITKKLAKITTINIKDIEKLFEEVAKSNQEFAKQFYDYRGKKYIPFDENTTLQNQVKAISKLTSQEYSKMARSNALGFAVKNEKGDVIYQGLKQTYDDVIDKAIINVSQGKITFEDEMYRILKELGISGIKTLNYNGRTMRLDSAIRMHLNDALGQLHNEMVIDMAKAYDADGVEISVLSNPAPDHQYVQGKQFSNTEFDKFQNDKDASSYDGVYYPATSEETGYDRRSIAQYNCRHRVFPIILGVSKQKYSNEELQKIIDDNNKGFDFDGKHYTNYEGSQLQRKIETKIREQKDLQILGRTSGNDKLARESQIKINQLTRKYKELSKASGLQTMTEKMRVSGYKPIKAPINYIEINKTTNVDLYVKMLDDATKFKDSLTENEYKTISNYTGLAYDEINETLVKGKPKDFYYYSNVDDIKKDIDIIDGVMAKSKITNNIKTFRGTSSNYYKDRKIGDVFTTPIFSSTSIHKGGIVERFAYNSSIKKDTQGAILEIRVPKGTHGIFISDLYSATNEQELLLDRNLKYKVLNIKTGKYIGYKGYYKYIILEVIK